MKSRIKEDLLECGAISIYPLIELFPGTSNMVT